MTSKAIQLRRGKPGDALPCGEICWKAFTIISKSHNFPPDFPSAEVAVGLMRMLLDRQDVYSTVAELDARIVGSNFLWEADMISGVGPITVDPEVQNAGIGRRLMQDVLDRASGRHAPGVRLVQAAFHSRSLSLYTKLGFEVREPLATIQGPAIKSPFPGRSVLSATMDDVVSCAELCRRIHGHDRTNELLGAINQESACVVERDGVITGYTTGIGFFGHAVAVTNDDLKALIAAAPKFAGPGFLLPTANTELFKWCLANGLRVTQPLTLMSQGLYNDPHGPWLPSILF